MDYRKNQQTDNGPSRMESYEDFTILQRILRNLIRVIQTSIFAYRRNNFSNGR